MAVVKTSRGPFELELVATRSVAPGTTHFVFRRADGETMAFRPGQFAMFHFHDDDGVAFDRSYSFAAAPDGSPHAEFSIALLDDGRGGRKLSALQVGGRVQASGPHGRFVLRDEAVRRYVLVATGTGIGPYRAMLPSLVERFATSPLRVHLIFGCRTADDLLYADELHAFAASHPAFTWEARLSRGAPDESAYPLRSGYVQAGFGELGLDPAQDVVYLCGNPNMIDDATARLVDLGWSPYAVRREKYVSA
jgi:ferredoxin-NADP reductase